VSAEGDHAIRDSRRCLTPASLEIGPSSEQS
jgi:hypothetical protein